MTIWDPLRRKEVARTPEEEVRQWFIGVLHDSLGVPMHMMMSEVGMKYGSKTLRADIVCWGRDGLPLVCVECKRPDVELGSGTCAQAARYDKVLGVRYVIITNGKNVIMFEKGESGFGFIEKAPKWEEMICQQ